MRGIDREAMLEFVDEEIRDLEDSLEKLRAARAIFSGERGIRHASQERVGRSPKKSGRRTAKRSRDRQPNNHTADADPIARKGPMPKVGVQQQLCETLAERQAKVRELQGTGYVRVGVHGRVLPGTFDVRPSGDGGESVFVLWREKEGEAK